VASPAAEVVVFELVAGSFIVTTVLLAGAFGGALAVGELGLKTGGRRITGTAGFGDALSKFVIVDLAGSFGGETAFATAAREGVGLSEAEGLEIV